MNLLMFNLATDADDPLLSFTTGWINGLAAHYERIDVVTMRTGRLAVAPNVRVWSVGKEKGYSEARRLVEFYRIVLRLRRERDYAACFAHMMPLFVALGAPVLRGVPITLWYAHRQPSFVLRLATLGCYRIVTSVEASYPLATDRKRVIGQGMDTEFFAPADDAEDQDMVRPAPTNPAYVVHVARLMPIKHQATLIRALADVPDAHAVFVGDVPPDVDGEYRRELETLADELGVAARVTFAGNQDRGGVRDWNRQAALAVNLSPRGLFDKAALEGMAVGVPMIFGDDSFDSLLGGDARLRIPAPDDHVALADRLRVLLALTPGERREIGMKLRAQVIEKHSFAGLMKKLVSVLNTGEIA